MFDDYKYALEELAEQIARENYGMEFYDLSEELQDKVYQEAMEYYADNFASQIDSLRNRRKYDER